MAHLGDRRYSGRVRVEDLLLHDMAHRPDPEGEVIPDPSDDEEEEEEDNTSTDYGEYFQEEEEEEEIDYDEEDEDVDNALEDFWAHSFGGFARIPYDSEDDDDDSDDSRFTGHQWRHRHADNSHEDEVPLEELKVSVLPDREQEWRSDFDRDVEDHLCAICISVVQDPVGCGVCQGRFCRACLHRHYHNRSNSDSIGVSKCPTCRNLMVRGVVTDSHYAAFLASEPFTCRYQHCGLRILAEQLRRHEKLFCLGVRVACKYAPLGCEWKGYKGSVRYHEAHECGIATNPGLLAFISKNRQANSRLQKRIRDLEHKQDHEIRMVRHQIQSALRRQDFQRHHHQQQQQQQQNVRQASQRHIHHHSHTDESDTPGQYKINNPFHLMLLVCHSFVTPRAVTSRSPWRGIVTSYCKRAFIHNSVALSPMMIIVAKLSVHLWKQKEHFVTHGYTVADTVHQLWAKRGKNNNGTTEDMENIVQGPFSTADWLRLVAVPLAGMVAWASLHSDPHSPISWSGDLPPRGHDFDNEEDDDDDEDRPRPFHKRWQRANYTVAILILYACALSLLQHDAIANGKHFGILVACILYTSLVVPTMLISFLEAAARNGRYLRQPDRGLAHQVRLNLTHGNANAPLVVVMTCTFGILLCDSWVVFLDVWYLSAFVRYRVLPVLVRNPRENLKFILQACFQDDGRTGMYMVYTRYLTAFFAMAMWFLERVVKKTKSYVFQSSTKMAATIDSGHPEMLELEEATACPANETTTTTTSSTAMTVAITTASSFADPLWQAAKARLVVLGAVLGTTVLLSQVFQLAGRFGIHAFHTGRTVADFQWEQQQFLARVYVPGAFLFLLYVLALQQICEI